MVMRSILRERTPGSTVLAREILSWIAILAENSPEHHLKYYTIRIIPVKLCNLVLHINCRFTHDHIDSMSCESAATFCTTHNRNTVFFANSQSTYFRFRFSDLFRSLTLR